MDRMEAFRLAVAELGEAPAERLSAFVQSKYGVRIAPRFIPLYRASLRDLEGLGRLRSVSQFAPPKPAAVCAPMGARQAQQLARELLADHGLHDWRFAFNRRKQAMGLCVYERRTIELSIHFVMRNAGDEVRDTILHEIAHALVGHGHGHDRFWKRKCLEVGARPQRCGHADMPQGRWRARCGGCGKSFHRHRRPKRLPGWFCRLCGPQRGKLMWSEEADGLTLTSAFN